MSMEMQAWHSLYQAMHASELEAEVAGLNAQLSAMAGERDRLSAMLTASPLGRAEGA